MYDFSNNLKSKFYQNETTDNHTINFYYIIDFK